MAEADPGEAPNEEKACTVFDKCCKCKSNITSRDSKLLPCLHNLCLNCWTDTQTETQGKPQCPECKQHFNKYEVIDNLFISIEEDSPKADDGPSVCTSCDENAEVSSYCMECIEWLCDQCVQAHKRVRVTKDHNIVDKEMVQKDSGKAAKKQQALFCPEHRQEQLKLYCETCQQLTCRDCQLENHKDHRYLFLQDASEQYLNYLKSYMTKLKEKMSHVDKAKLLIDSRNNMITKREEEVEKEIKTFATKLMYEIQNRGRTLINDLKALCKAKRNHLTVTNLQVATLYQKLCHSLEFVQEIIRSSDPIALLHSKKLIVKQLNNITLATCEVPNPNHNVDIRFKPTSFTNNDLRVGTLTVDGTSYRGLNPKSNEPDNAGSQQASRRQEMMRKIANLPPDQREQYMRAYMLGKFSHQPQSGNMSHVNNHGKNVRLAPKPMNTVVTSQMNNMVPLNQMQHRHPTGGSTVHHQPAPMYTPPSVTYIVNQPNPIISASTFPNAPTNGHVQMRFTGSRIVSQPPGPISTILPTLAPYPAPVAPAHVSNSEQIPSPHLSSSNGSPTDKQTEPAGKVKQERFSIDSKPLEGSAEHHNDGNEMDNSTLFDDMNEDFPHIDQHISNQNSVDSPRRERQENNGNTFPISDQMLADDADPSDDFCAVCHNGGDLLCCDTCPKVFHLQCHVPNLLTNPSGEWQCGLCTDLGTESIEYLRLEQIGGKRKAPTGLTDYEIKVCERILLLLLCHAQSPPFHEPVSKSVPNYYKVITNPMDFTNIKCKLSRSHFNHYDCVQDFVSDVKLVFSNCATYNASESPVWKAGQIVEEYFGDLLHQFFPNQVSSGQGAPLEKHPNKRKKKPEDIVHYPS